MPPSRPADPLRVTPALLAERPLPDHASVHSKYDRGVALVIGGSAETPGAVLLAGVAALRVGAGKLQIVTAADAAAAVGVAVPEARVVAVPTGRGGWLDPSVAERIAPLVEKADAIVVGTGSLDPDATGQLLRRVLEVITGAVLVIDAAALPALGEEPGLLAPLDGRAVVMPNPGEMCKLIGGSVEDVVEDPRSALTEAVARLGVTVTLRGIQTWTAAPGSAIYMDEAGNPGLATSGSGDVVAGTIVGLAARGADPLTAALWATHLHATAGDRCATRIGVCSYLARELLDELPAALRAVGG
jgi:hydroxyethylthiazole kinase-like uncharacterized protein yjeF